MFKDEFKAVVNGGVGKVNFLKNNPLGYFVAAMVAGMFISFGSFVAFTLGAVINAYLFRKFCCLYPWCCD